MLLILVAVDFERRRPSGRRLRRQRVAGTLPAAQEPRDQLSMWQPCTRRRPIGGASDAAAGLEPPPPDARGKGHRSGNAAPS